MLVKRTWPNITTHSNCPSYPSVLLHRMISQFWVLNVCVFINTDGMLVYYVVWLTSIYEDVELVGMPYFNCYLWSCHFYDLFANSKMLNFSTVGNLVTYLLNCGISLKSGISWLWNRHVTFWFVSCIL